LNSRRASFNSATVVPSLELAESLVQLGDGREVMDPQPVRFDGPDEVFHDAVRRRGRMQPIRTSSRDGSV
jgi:hypothetical protein